TEEGTLLRGQGLVSRARRGAGEIGDDAVPDLSQLTRLVGHRSALPSGRRPGRSRTPDIRGDHPQTCPHLCARRYAGTQRETRAGPCCRLLWRPPGSNSWRRHANNVGPLPQAARVTQSGKGMIGCDARCSPRGEATPPAPAPRVAAGAHPPRDDVGTPAMYPGSKRARACGSCAALVRLVPRPTHAGAEAPLSEPPE